MDDEQVKLFHCPAANELREYMRHGRIAMQQIAMTDSRLKVLEGKARHLERLDDIAEALKGVREDLVGPATGRKQIPLSAALMLFAFMGIICILVMVNNTRKDIELGWNKIKISTAPAELERAEAAK